MQNDFTTQGFDQPIENFIKGPSSNNTKAAPQKSGGLLSRIVGGITQAPKYFLNNDIIDPAVSLIAQAKGDRTVENYINQKSNQDLGLGNNNNLAGGLKKLVGNTAQLAGTAIAPEADAGVGAKIVAGAKAGSIIGGGSALANNQNVLQGAAEGALGGAALPVAGAITGKVGGKLLGVGGKPSDVTAADISTGDSTSLLAKAKANVNNHLQNMEASANGANAGAKLPGSGPAGITQSQADNLAQLHEKYNIPAGSPSTQLRDISNKLQQAGGDIQQKLEQNNVPLSTEDRQAIMGEFQKNIDQQPNAASLKAKANELEDHFVGKTPATINGQPISAAIADQLGVKSSGSGVQDLVGMNKYRQLIDDGINYNRQAGSPDPIAEQVGQIARSTLSDQLNKYAPDVASANKTFSDLKQLEAPALMKNNQLSQNQGGLVNRAFNNGPMKGLESKLTNLGVKATGGLKAATPTSQVASSLPEDATASATPAASSNGPFPGVRSSLSSILGSQGSKKAATLGVASGLSQPSGTSDNSQTSSSPSELTDLNTADTTSLGSITDTSGQDQSQSPFTQEQLLEAINADPAHGSTYIDLYKELNPTSTNGGLDTTQQKELSSGEAALAVLQNYGNTLQGLQQAGNAGNGVSGRVSTTLGHIPFSSSGDQQALAFQQTQADTASQIATVLAGGKPSTTLIKQVEESLPSVNDTQQTGQAKMNKLIQSVESVMRAQSTPVSSIVAGLQQ